MSDADQIEAQMAAEHEWTESRRALAETSDDAMLWAAGLADRNAAEVGDASACAALHALATEIRGVVAARRKSRGPTP